LLARQVFEVVVDHFAAQFSVVIVDTPAISETADAQILAANAGSAIIIGRRNCTLQSKLQAAMETLTQSGVNVVGSVLNDY
jgi:protein-tyrosine kinase